MAHAICLSPATNAAIDVLADRLAALYADHAQPRRPAWLPYPLRVVDVALAVGLGRGAVVHAGPDYHARVVPSVQQFAEQYPNVRTLGELRAVVAPSPEGMAASLWEDPARGAVLLHLVEHLLRDAPSGHNEAESLTEWAMVSLGDPGGFYDGDFELVGAEGFQYLRAQFGAPVVVPGEHVEVFAREMTSVRGLMPEDDVGLAAARAGLAPDAVEGALWRDYAAGQAWGAGAAPEQTEWVRVFSTLCQAIRERSDPDSVAQLRQTLPSLGVARGYREVAALTLAALDDRGSGRAFDAEGHFVRAHRAAVRQIRAFRAAPRLATAAFLSVLGDLALCTSEQIFARDRLIP
ncbi:MAG: hypothetical protein AAGJ10_03370 [Bacteroidota bacterium]